MYFIQSNLSKVTLSLVFGNEAKRTHLITKSTIKICHESMGFDK